MTLSTDIVVVDPVNPGDLFQHCLRLLQAPEDTATRHGPGVYSTEPGQGLPAWTFVYYAIDGPLVWCDPEDFADEPGWEPPPGQEHCVRVNFDTGYGYREGGAGCGDLHAWLVTEVGRWLDERGVRWCWDDECAGAYYPGTVSPDLLGDAALGALA